MIRERHTVGHEPKIYKEAKVYVPNFWGEGGEAPKGAWD